MTMRRASSPRVITSHDDPEDGGGEHDEALEALAAGDHGDEQHYAEHDGDGGVAAVERPEPSHQRARIRSSDSSRASQRQTEKMRFPREAALPRRSCWASP